MLLDEFHTDYVARCSAATGYCYTKGAQAYLVFLEQRGLTPLTASRESLAEFIAYGRELGWTAGTLRFYAFAVGRYMRWLRERYPQVVQLPTVKEAGVPRLKSRLARALSEAELEAYRKGCKSLRDPCRTLMAMLPYTGLRIFEACSLRYPDLVMRRGRLTLLVLGKGKKEREVPLTNTGIEILSTYVSGWRKKYVAEHGEHPYLFPGGVEGRPITPARVRQTCAKVKALAGISVLTPHTLRRTYATILHDSGMKIGTIMRLLGHSNINTTVLYIGMDTEAVAEEMQAARL